MKTVAKAVRRAIWNRAKRQQPVEQIASELGLPERTVRHLLSKLRKHGEQALEPSYGDCGIRRTDAFEKMRKTLFRLHQQHSNWGAGRLLVELRRISSKKRLPSDRTVQRWLREQAIPPAKPGRPKRERPVRSETPHEVWQVDAVEQKRLATGEMFSWLRVADECSGAVLGTVVFSRGTLQLRSALASTNALSKVLQAVGVARRGARGQWRSLGVLWRFSHGFGVVVDRIGREVAVESSSHAARQRSHRTDSWRGAVVGRSEALHEPSTASQAASARRPSATGRVSFPRRQNAFGGLSSIGTAAS